MVSSAPSTIPFTAPGLDAVEAQLAAAELAGLIRRLGADTVPGLILRQAQHELESLVRSAGGDASVIGPVRVRVAA